jgi:hypothetical protein
MMDHINEHTLELMVMDPEQFPAGRRTEILAHCGECPGCRALQEEIRALHHDLQEQQGVPSPMLGAAIGKIFAKSPVIQLTHYHPHLQVPAGASYSGILAAMAPEAMSHEGYETVATFASEADHILLRVRQDAGNRRVRLYYHADDPTRQLGPVVTLPALGADAVIDDQGRSEFRIETPRSPREWSQLEALVAFPVCSLLRTASGSVTITQETAHSYEVVLEPRGGVLEVRCANASPAPPIRRAVIWAAEGKPVVVEMDSGRASVAGFDPAKSLLIRLYV